MFYLVTIKTTDTLEAGRSATSWTRQVVYSGTSFEEARIAYVRELALDHGGTYGDPARRTVMERFKSQPAEMHEVAVEKSAT